MVNEDLQNFRENMKSPWGLLYYRLVWAQLAEIINIKNLKILDFGSGFGITANYFAKNNEVTATEMIADMIEERECDNYYTQIHGKIEKLKDFENGYFDVVICHNVLEFAEERVEIVKEFSRVLKSGGILSIVKHNRTGIVMRRAVFDNDINGALSLLDGGDRTPNAFGKVNYYNPEDLIKWGDNLKIEKLLGVQAFFGLQQNNEPKYEPEWQDKMFALEMKVCDLEPYKSIAFLHHVLLRKL